MRPAKAALKVSRLMPAFAASGHNPARKAGKEFPASHGTGALASSAITSSVRRSIIFVPNARRVL